ncbi:hypothetical protein [Streptomyces sp. NPDC088196]|uniref:hypothetical protein n=1 Tax=Streptomyces sp. NPDC088196 TaxID=3154868 RepID=UPI00344BB168
MAAKRGKAACNLVLLTKQEGLIEELTGEPAVLVLGDKNGNSLLRLHLERRSDPRFLDELSGHLRDEGISAGAALSCLCGVVNAPGVALTRKCDGNGREFLQAVLMRDKAAEDSYLVSLRVVTSAGKPPEVVDAKAELLPVDIPQDLTVVAEYLEDWWREFSVRDITLPELSKPKNFVWLGDPQTSGYSDVPADWQARLKTAAAVLGMRSQIVTSPNQVQARRSQLFDTADVIVRLRGWGPGRDAVKADAGEYVELVVGAVGSRFSDLLSEVRQELVQIALRPDRQAMYEKRELEPGEIVYHRKIGESKKFDHFDEGSSKPCGCNKGFANWNNAPKASQGMARRYSNFYEKDVQLKHCPRYPNCNVYAVERRSSEAG